MADESTIRTAGDHNLIHLLAKLGGSRLHITVAQASRLVLIGEQHIHMVADEPAKRLAVTFGAPGIGQ